MHAPPKPTAKSLQANLPHLTPAEWVTFGAFGVFCFVFPFATFLLSFDLMPFGMEWMSSLLLAMLGLAAGGWMWVNFGPPGGLASAAIFVLSVGLEYVGVGTGFPFGQYRYTGVLVPELPGGVPLAIGCAWLLVVVAGLFTARWLLAPYYKRGSTSPVWLQVFLGAAFALCLDLLLEPVAFHVKGYWEWLNVPSGEGYYGVPWLNFVAWPLAVLAFNIPVALATQGRQLKWAWLPVALLGLNALLFGVVNLVHGFWLAGVVEMAVLAAVWLVGVKPRGDMRARLRAVERQ